ncbi:MAG: bifunctional metallophosphatase/5'-nucleotidase [Paramuribaculum sp.]|nr:bifunctional metallophosphatase/5'-nucleotidase [Paramuribaculum sp.]
MASVHNITVIYTTDVHGNFFPYNFITRSPDKGSLARVCTFVNSVRDSIGSDKVVLLDNGDILQGQPTAYYYNFIDTVSPHIVSRIYDFMGYDAATIGNHDIETGHAVYDKYRLQTKTPILGANVIDTTTGKPYLTPYQIIERDNIRIAIIGMLTPAIPAWLPENLWNGLKFNDIAETAQKLIQDIQTTENPDIIIGLFHSGADSSTDTSGYHENASVSVAQQVKGFDAILMGHDHRVSNQMITTPDGTKIPVINPANNANKVGTLNITLEKDIHNRIIRKDITGDLINVATLAPSTAFINHFANDIDKVNEYVNRIIGCISDTITTQDSFFGASPFMNLIHKLQLDISGADISFAAPLSFNASINKGQVRVSDMFTLYKYENMLYTMNMTGKEIKNYLEMSYDLWTRQITSNNRHIINFAEQNPDSAHNSLLNPSYNFDSAYGIDYTVDVTKPKGEKIKIISLSNGSPWNPDSIYTVAMNSYRGNGGGDILTLGAGINRNEIPKRIIKSTDKDLRYYLIKQIETSHNITPDHTANWKFIPETIVKPILETDRKVLFNNKTSKQQK